MSIALLDVNVLLALAWPSHIHHEAAHDWLSIHQSGGWATCPMTQCSFVRISSNLRALPEAVEPVEALALLRMIVARDGHHFWTDDLALYETIVPADLLSGYRQVTDFYLLGLAINHGGRLATFDKGVAALVSADEASRQAVELIEA